MWLVLCDSTDAPASWAYQGLRNRGLEPIELVTSEALAYARWVHRIGADGAQVEIALPDGRWFRSDRIRGTLNRLLYPPQECLLLIHPSDRSYVIQELTAFFMSWLHALPGPVLNPPTPQSLCGRVRHISEWLWLAGKAGLPAPPHRQSSQGPSAQFSVHVRLVNPSPELRTILVVGQHVVGAPAPRHINEGCRRLGDLSRTPLLGVEFSCGPQETWELAGVTTLPDLRLGGTALLNALVSCFHAGRGGAG